MKCKIDAIENIFYFRTMKKIILFGLLIAASLSTFAQLPSFNLGLKAGMNLSSLKADKTFGEENRLGYQIGAWARVGGMGFYVQPEAYLASKGGKFNIPLVNNVQEEARARFTTLDVPVLLGTKIGTDKMNIRFMAGPMISFVLDKSVKGNVNQVTDFGNYKNQTWAAQLGAGVDLGSLSVDLRYEAGLSNVNNTDQYSQKQRLWHLSVGYKIF